jgi:hypothetical protein
LWTSNPVHHLDSSLFTAARYIKAAGFEEKIKEFEDPERKRQNIYGNYTFSQASEKLSDEEKRFKRQEEVEPWGAWHQLPMVPKFVYDFDDYVEECRAEVKENPELTFTFYNFLGIAGELQMKCMTAFCVNTKRNKQNWLSKCKTIQMQTNSSISLQI